MVPNFAESEAMAIEDFINEKEATLVAKHEETWPILFSLRPS
ncbi:predicted protein [Sclerotinia sclerotiorum 1980 UF-70]|uniref:Uncharacterized protein n=1 Tax=Sclerotinia sclerotiorum (strain ATCC 18683 / 1980 / Ss-1) TaxID=665079 RepID=A7EE83_SCLS1|nr:predicted protein [Sclerotinia sclerotiorum 1980 UF-70]EDO01149.1 predicted protein [Sclerotinia sclerotiorum 1980 UF-70]